jgi:hypothetical protein
MVRVCPNSGEEFGNNAGSSKYRIMMQPTMSNAIDIPTAALRPILNSDNYPKDSILACTFICASFQLLKKLCIRVQEITRKDLLRRQALCAEIFSSVKSSVSAGGNFS